jgi:hypothetical protein
MPTVFTQRKANNNNDKTVEMSVRRIEGSESRRTVAGITTILNSADKVKHVVQSAVSLTSSELPRTTNI